MPNSRLREPPNLRFEGSEFICDLQEEFDRLPDESIARHGHMQKTVNKSGRLTCAVFVFERGSRLDPHTIRGEAILHVLDGRLEVQADEGNHVVSSGQLLMLEPGVVRKIRATQASQVLMHVILE